MGRWHAALFALIGASASLAGCATEESDDGLYQGTFAVTGLDLGSCANDTWLKSATATTTVVVEASGEEYVVKACTEQGGVRSCSPSSPSSFAWNVDRWQGTVGGAYLVENGCLLVHVDATAHVIERELVIETTRWAGELSSGTCTFAEVTAMRERPCDGRSRLYAIAQ